MLGLKMDKPASCLYCPVRMNCQEYIRWLWNKKRTCMDLKAFEEKDCLLVDLNKYEDDLK